MSATTLNPESLAACPPADDAAVLGELWISFVGLMRSHLAALQTIGKLVEVKLVETSPKSFIAGDLNGNIAVSFNPVDGQGRYELKSCGGPSEHGLWQLHADGTTSLLSGGAGTSTREDMELAVERFAHKLSEARTARLEGANL